MPSYPSISGPSNATEAKSASQLLHPDAPMVRDMALAIHYSLSRGASFPPPTPGVPCTMVMYRPLHVQSLWLRVGREATEGEKHFGGFLKEGKKDEDLRPENVCYARNRSGRDERERDKSPKGTRVRALAAALAR